ncbi:hypothetical protein LASUN_11440 [Lentilactobacillus sunkii]|jgi:predicted DNA-binding protein (MmcQ/YjbR family)|uniref:MmcQ/YjbR family DNA-binding protein n=1 Tax=Lentilactobacillus sunkii TaxID=481719 RepID=A0A1E7XDL7_9LACO|nr:MmcQ/YjbR family DNA-binding protein [Lentilactobacillus sunkii]OFA11072.1 hypothetical protein LASUN_11440 [Lentilactobacillus sunkii]
MDREEIVKYVDHKYHTQPAYLWKKYPTYAALRHADNRKWYGLIMTVEKTQLGLYDDGTEEIMDVKLDRKEVEFRQGTPGFLPAYHMNKSNWISIRIGLVDSKKIHDLIDTSYQLTEK